MEPKKKLIKRNVIISLIALPVLLFAWLFAWDYHRANIDQETSAVPQAKELRPYVEQHGVSVLHTYNRSAKGIMSAVSTPSYEYYLEFPTADTGRYADELTGYLSGLGYKMKKARYAKDDYCGPDAFRYPRRVDGYHITENQARQYCIQKVGHDDSDLFGTAVNGNQPYWVVYGTRGIDTVYVQITDKDFAVYSNDFWREAYMKEAGFTGTRVREGKSVATIMFDRKDQD